MQLYTYFRSGNGRKVHLALEELGMDYTIVPVDLAAGENRQPDYLRLNPNGKVPTLVDGELTLWESSAILLYLAEAGTAPRLLPEDRAQRARAYKWLVWQPAVFNPPLQRLVGELRKPDAAARDAAVITQARAAIERNLEILAEALGAQEYLLARRFTLADLVMVPHLWALRDLRVHLPPTLEHYLDRLAARASWQRVLAYTG